MGSSFSNKYDVFLSFRGENTRDYFTSHLHDALRRNQIETFIDNQLIRGDEIPPSLLNAIKQSKIAVVILSEGYASSRWCLKELVKILRCKNKYGQIVIPVFYGVDPSDVRNLTGNFGDGFSKLEERFMERKQKLQKWRNALREVADVSGFDSRAIRPESTLVQQIVNDILKRLNHMFPTEPDKYLVGIESHFKEFSSLVNNNFNGVHIVGIWGIGGIGKTTIARVIFNRFSNYFNGSCFLKNIREESEKIGGLAQLQQKFLSTLLVDGNLNDCNSSFNLARLSRKKVLIIFDDVTDFEQIESLIQNRFGNGSLIFITTRDKQILQNCGANIEYEMKELEYDSALKLFSRHAFKRDQPNVGYENLSFTIIKYCHGVPLALKILGHSLFGKSKGVWESSIEKLERIPHDKIQNVLKISYDGLDDVEKNIFLDIACFLKGENKDFAIKFLDACGYYAERGLSNLEDKCLVKLSEHNEIIMHDLLQQMGWEIVREESENNYGKRSRLWHHEEICEVLEDNTETEAIQAISLNMFKLNEIELNLDIFKKMPNLRFLKFYGDNKFKICDFENRGYIFRKLRFFHRYNFESSGYIFRKLRFFHWEEYPLKELSQNICAKNLVFLKLPRSKVEQLWHGVQDLVNLKVIDLSYSKHLTTLPDLSRAQNLETLILNCCKSLNSLPSSIGSESLKVFEVAHCSNLKRLPEILSCNLVRLCLHTSGIEEVPSFIEYQSRLDYLTFWDCSRLEHLPSGLCKMKSLRHLSFNGCKNLRRLPEELGNLEALKELKISGTLIREVPSSILCLNNLRMLILSGLRGHKKDDFISSISSSFVGLRHLDLIDCDITELPENLCQLSSLRCLDLSENNFERIPDSIINLSKLLVLYLHCCQRLQSLPMLPFRLRYLGAENCTSLESRPSLSHVFRSPMLSRDGVVYNFKNCYKLGGDEGRRIFEESLQKIQLMDNWACDFTLDMYFPGSEIPKWFKNRSTGSSIILQLPPADSQKLIGFGFGIAFEGHQDGEEARCPWYTLQFKTTGRKRFVSFVDLESARYVGSNSVTLGYHLFEDKTFDSQGKLSDINEAFIQFDYDVREFDRQCGNHCKLLKEWGIHLLYAQNSGESFKDCNTSFSSTDDEEEEEGN